MMPGKKPYDVEAGRPFDEGHRRGNDAPRDHHAGYPQSRADLVKNDVGGHFEHEVAPEEDAGAEAEHRGGEAQVRLHRERREADVDPVDISDEVQQHDERHDAPGDPAQGAFFQIDIHRMSP
jgi:hypothetical protein